MCRVFEGASVCVGSGSRERWHRESGSAGVGGRDVASSRAVLEQQLSCGKAGRLSHDAKRNQKYSTERQSKNRRNIAE